MGMGGAGGRRNSLRFLSRGDQNAARTAQCRETNPALISSIPAKSSGARNPEDHRTGFLPARRGRGSSPGGMSPSKGSPSKGAKASPAFLAGKRARDAPGGFPAAPCGVPGGLSAGRGSDPARLRSPARLEGDAGADSAAGWSLISGVIARPDGADCCPGSPPAPSPAELP